MAILKRAIQHIGLGLLALTVTACGRREAPPSSVDADAGSPPGADASQTLISLHPDLGDCPDNGPRLALSRICETRAVDYINAAIGAAAQVPAPCDWRVKELPLATDVLLYRALDCGAETTRLDLAVGAQASELSYRSSASHGDDWTDRIVARIYTDVDGQPDYRMKASFVHVSENTVLDCEITPAGDGYPEGAQVIRPTSHSTTTDCGPMAVNAGGSDNFWRRDRGYVFAFSLPQGDRDIDTASFIPIAAK